MRIRTRETSFVFCSVWMARIVVATHCHIDDPIDVLDLSDLNGSLYFLNHRHLSFHCTTGTSAVSLSKNCTCGTSLDLLCPSCAPQSLGA